MKRYNRWFWIVGVVFFLSMFLPVFVQAQDEPPCAGPDPYYGDCPIDSGLVFLLIAGAAYGIKKIIDARKLPLTQMKRTKSLFRIF